MKFIKINAVWCPACIITNKVWKKIEKEYKNLDLEELDFDFDEDEVKKYNIGEVLPVVIVLDKDKEVTRLVGEHSEKEIYEFVEKYR